MNKSRFDFFKNLAKKNSPGEDSTGASHKSGASVFKKIIHSRYSYYVAGAAVIALVAVTGAGAVSPKGNVGAFNEKDGLISQGTVECKEVSINSKLPGRIRKIYVEEGSEVKAGDVLVEIEDDDLEAKKEQAVAQLEAAKAGYEAAQSESQAAEAAYNAAKGQVEAARAALEKANNGARKQEIAQAQAGYDLWKKTYDRVQKLFDKGAVSAQKLDEVKTQLEVAAQQLSIAQEGARSEDKLGAQALLTQALSMEQAAADKAAQARAGVKAAKEKVDMAQGAVQEVEAYLKDTKITAPMDGVVTVVNSHEGELVSSGMSIATVTDLKSPWIEVKVKETDIGKLSVGQSANLRVPGFSDRTFQGKIVRINEKPDFATKRSTNDNGDFDILSYGVKIELSNNDKILRPGQTGFVQFVK
ncbi:MAG: efflux RND transporter periplasmic adaptor subunit [Clostridiales bacterium]|jgi:HlyD family secretion protein|nr:efflux RND transporter periplasmic adaptor subunit [Eubacteriales bacterium]MDH7567243.1 efflux RND transporter periplasmic adaptor subunit [Clostridiales bacterium]